MTESKNNKNSEEKRESFFEIMDGIMLQMSKTKKMFLIMILTTLILPPISLLVMTSVFDSPFGLDREGFERHKEWETISYELRNLLLEIGELPPDQRAEKMEEVFQSSEYIELSSRLRELSDQEKKFEFDPPRKLPVRPLQLIIFVLSGIWLGVGVRQWYIFSKWDVKYQAFKMRNEELDKRIDEEPEDKTNNNEQS